MDVNHAERRIPVYKLLSHKHILKQLLSFSANVVKCNFTVTSSWKGKSYVDKHEVDEYQPEQLRGVELLEVYYLKLTDTVVLTEEQYKDYKLIAGLD